MKNNYFLIIGFLLIVIVSGCIGGTKTPYNEVKYQNISVFQANEMTMNPLTFILDVRTQQEYAEGHLKDAKLIPFQDLNKKLDEIPNDKNILVYSNDARSINASEILINNGFKYVYNMEEGILGWSKGGFEIEK